MTRSSRYGLGLAFAGTLVLSFDAMFLRLSAMNALQMTAWRGLLMGTVLILVWRVQSGGPRSDLRYVATLPGLTIIICQFFNSLLFCIAISIAPAAVVLFGLASVPVFAAFFARLVIGEPTPTLTWIAILLVMSGIGLAVSGDGLGGDTGRAAFLGATLGIGVAVVLALNFVTVRARPDLPIALLIGLGAAVAGILSTILVGPAAMAEGHIWAMVATGAVLLPISFLSLSVASRHTHASNVSLLMLLETVLGPTWVWLAVGEAPTVRMIAGGAIVVTSLAGYRTLLMRSDRIASTVARAVESDAMRR